MQNKLIVNHRILYIGIGIFFLFSTENIAFLFQEIVMYFLINFGIAPIFILIIKELVRFVAIFLSFVILSKLIRINKIKSPILFISLIGLLLLAQILQFVFPIIMNNFRMENYLENSARYYEYIQTNPWNQFIIVIPEYLIYIFLGIYVYRNQNLFDN